MQTAVGDFVVVGAHTEAPQVFWRGQPVPDVAEVVIDTSRNIVILKVKELPQLAEMAAAGITVRRV